MWVFGESPPEGGVDATNLKITYKAEHAQVEYRYGATDEDETDSDEEDPGAAAGAGLRGLGTQRAGS